MENKNESKKIILIIAIVVLIAVIGGILVKSSGDENNSSSTGDTGSEVVNVGSNEVIENTSDMEKLKSSEYTSEGFDNVKIGDSFDSIEENIGKLEKIDVESNYDTYVFSDEELGSKYVFYFSNNELKEVSVFLV